MNFWPFRAKKNDAFRLDIQSIWAAGTKVVITLPLAPPPPWHVPSIEVKEGQTVIVIDDDESIHQFWNTRLSQLVEAKTIHVRSYYGPEEVMGDTEFLASHQQSALFLVDQEYAGHASSGLDFIEQLSIQENAILVTSRNEDVDLIRRCESLHVALLPKNVAEWLDVRVV